MTVVCDQLSPRILEDLVTCHFNVASEDDCCINLVLNLYLMEEGASSRLLFKSYGVL